MKRFFLLAGLVLLAVFLSGCTAPQNNTPPVCAQVITYGIDSSGNCIEFPTSCLPSGYTKVDSCPNPCAGITCADKCDGTTRLSNGVCQSGQCVYSTTNPDSIECGYSAFHLVVEPKLQYCNYSPSFQNFTLFLSVKNTGDTTPKPNSSVWLVSPQITRKIYMPIYNTYIKGVYWWQEVFTDKNYRGQIFEINNEPAFRDFDYKFIYCELANNNLDSCDETNGQVLYTGNTTRDCNTVS